MVQKIIANILDWRLMQKYILVKQGKFLKRLHSYICCKLCKRSKRLKDRFTKWMKMSTFLKWHIYAGIIGPILALIHTGHRFDSLVGIVLTLLMLLVVLSGFIGRYLLAQISTGMREKKKLSFNLLEQYESYSKQVKPSFAKNTAAYLPFFFKKMSLAFGLNVK